MRRPENRLWFTARRALACAVWCAGLMASVLVAMPSTASGATVESILVKPLPKAALQAKTGWVDVNKAVINITGSGVPLGFPATVTCTGSQGTSSHTLTLHDAVVSPFAANAGDTCTIAEAAVSNSTGAVRCPGSQEASWQAYYFPSATFTVSGATATEAMVVNVASCAKSDKGSLIVSALGIVNNTGGPWPPSVFSQFPYTIGTHVTCTPGGPTNAALPLSASLPNFLTNTVPNLPAGSQCSVVQDNPFPPVTDASQCSSGTAHWETSYSPPTATIVANQFVSITIVNTLVCDTANGSLTIIKKVVDLGNGVPPPPASFTATVNCPPTVVNQTVTLAPSSNYEATIGVPANSACTVTENSLPQLSADYVRKGCSWRQDPGDTTGIKLARAKGDKTRYITNDWVCPKGGKDTGILDVIKKIVSDTGAPPPPTVFYADVQCQPNGPNVTLELSSDNGFHNTATGIPMGATCTVTERVPPVPADLARKGCHWETGYTNGQKFGIGDLRANKAEIVNRWICKGDNNGTLTIIKKVVSDGPVPPPDVNFVIDVNCQPGGPQTSVTLNGSNNWQQTISGLAAGASCTTTEEPPQVPPEYKRRGCYWESDHPVDPTGNGNDRRRAMAAADKNTRVITNRWICKGDKDTGRLSLFKTVVNATGGPVPTMPSSFDLTAHCGVLSQTVHVPANNGVSLATALAAGTTCTVTEAPLPDIDRLKQCKGQPAVWTTTYSPGVTIPSSGNATLTVTNTLTCGKGDAGAKYDAGIVKTADGTWVSGNAGVFRLVVTNYGGSVPASTISIGDNLPAGMTLVGAAGSGWSCGSSNPVTCTYTGAVAQGQTLPPLLITVTLREMGHATNTAVVSMSGVSDSVPGNNASTITVNVSPPALIGNGGNGPAEVKGSTWLVGILATVTSGVVDTGGIGTFDVAVTNGGAPVPEAANFMVHSMLPSGLTLLTISPEGPWTCRTSGNDLSCRFMGTAPTGNLPKIRFSARANSKGTFNVCASAYLVTVKDARSESCATLRVGLDQPKGIPQPPPLIVPPPHTPHPKKDNPPPDHNKGAPDPIKGKP
jgi:uncharacterized repeat protein (TIGR01451 family)